jgi:hypothetical protein
MHLIDQEKNLRIKLKNKNKIDIKKAFQSNFLYSPHLKLNRVGVTLTRPN